MAVADQQPTPQSEALDWLLNWAEAVDHTVVRRYWQICDGELTAEQAGDPR